MTKEVGEKKLLVSVIIPVWNAGENIEKLIRELCAQTYSRLEIIAVDDGSTDDSLLVLQKLAKEDDRVRVLHQENRGVGAARNRGIEVSTGDYLVFVDADDEVEGDFIEALVEAIESKPEKALAVVGKRYNKLKEGKTVDTLTEVRRERGKTEKLSEYVIYLMILDGRMYGMAGKIFQAEPIRNHKIRVEEGRDFAEDTKFVIDYLATQGGEIACVPRALYVYNFGTETSIVRKSSLDWKNWEKSYQELEEWVRSENGGKLGVRARILLGLIRARWHVSHFKAQRRARK